MSSNPSGTYPPTGGSADALEPGADPAAYDLFGDGRTALKVALGRYVSKTAIPITQANNPITASINSVSRTWNDLFYDAPDPRRGNFVPDCDLANRALNGECGVMLNQSFGGFNPTTRYADDALRGFGARGYNWDFTTEGNTSSAPACR